MENYYKLYLKTNGSYEGPEIYPSKKKLESRLANLDQEYLLIHRHDDYDEIVSHKQATVKLVDNVKSDVKVNAMVFNTEDLKKKKRKQRKEDRKIQDEINSYIDR